MRRLHHQIFAGFVGVAVACALAAGVTARALHGDDLTAPPAAVSAMRLLAEELPTDPHARHVRMHQLAGRFGAELGLYERDGSTVYATAPGLPGPSLDGDPVQWFRARPGWGLRVRLSDGRWFQGALRRPPAFARLPQHVFILGVIAVVVALASLPVARRITRRLARVEEAMRRWGEGDLLARAPVGGRDEIASLARTWNRAADQVATLLEKERRVLASASHELRSPLARLRMAVELLDDGSEQKRPWAEGAKRDVEELDELVGDLLLASKARHGEVARDAGEVDLGALLREEARRIDAAEPEGEARVPGDGRMLRRMVRNLVENARRHGGGAVETFIEAGPALVIADRGPGIPEAERTKIWEPFYRPPGHREGEDGGVGLGLALVAEIATHHGAVARHEPREGGGSRFVVSWGPR